MQQNYDILTNYSLAAGVGIVVINNEGAELFASDKYDGQRRILQLLEKVMQNGDECKVSMIYGGYQSMRFGGKYIFFCPRGLVHLASPIIEKNRIVATVIAGPLLMMDTEEYIELDITKKFAIEKDGLEEIYAGVGNIPYADPKRVSALSELLFLSTEKLCDEPEFFDKSNRNQKLQANISENILKLKNGSDTGYYPIDKEQELLSAMRRGDAAEAKALLNEIFGHVLLQSGAKFEIIRSRVLELMVLLSRAAVQGGADAELIFGLNYEYLQQIDEMKNIEEITYWLSEIMNRFTQYVFHFAAAKHADVIYKVIDYLRRGYMNKITLEEASAHVYLSPSYLSRVFKEATGHNFNTYLNIIRIEESKKLLRDAGVSIIEVASLVGYEDQSYFTKVFKKTEGISPGKYRQSRIG